MGITFSRDREGLRQLFLGPDAYVWGKQPALSPEVSTAGDRGVVFHPNGRTVSFFEYQSGWVYDGRLDDQAGQQKLGDWVDPPAPDPDASRAHDAIRAAVGPPGFDVQRSVRVEGDVAWMLERRPDRALLYQAVRRPTWVWLEQRWLEPQEAMALEQRWLRGLDLPVVTDNR